jgi:hypothetical protein
MRLEQREEQQARREERNRVHKRETIFSSSSVMLRAMEGDGKEAVIGNKIRISNKFLETVFEMDPHYFEGSYGIHFFRLRGQHGVIRYASNVGSEDLDYDPAPMEDCVVVSDQMLEDLGCTDGGKVEIVLVNGDHESTERPLAEMPVLSQLTFKWLTSPKLHYELMKDPRFSNADHLRVPVDLEKIVDTHYPVLTIGDIIDLAIHGETFQLEVGIPDYNSIFLSYLFVIPTFSPISLPIILPTLQLIRMKTSGQNAVTRGPEIWICPICTVVNYDHATHCTTCESPAPAAPAELVELLDSTVPVRVRMLHGNEIRPDVEPPDGYNKYRYRSHHHRTALTITP